MKTDTSITARNKTFIQELRKAGKTGPEILKMMLAKDMKTATGKKPNVVYVYNSLQTKSAGKNKIVKAKRPAPRTESPRANQELEAVRYILDMTTAPAANKLNAIRILIQAWAGSSRSVRAFALARD